MGGAPPAAAPPWEELLPRAPREGCGAVSSRSGRSSSRGGGCGVRSSRSVRSSSRVRACDEVRFCPHSTRALVQPACRSRQPTVRLRRKRSSAMPKRQRDAASTDREQATADGAGDVCSDEEEEHAASAGGGTASRSRIRDPWDPAQLRVKDQLYVQMADPSLTSAERAAIGDAIEELGGDSTIKSRVNPRTPGTPRRIEFGSSPSAHQTYKALCPPSAALVVSRRWLVTELLRKDRAHYRPSIRLCAAPDTLRECLAP